MSASSNPFLSPSLSLSPSPIHPQTLLISDTVFRTNDTRRRQRLTSLVEEVEAGGGEAVVFSGAHSSGEQLNQLTGLAAILRFPLPDLEDQEFDADPT